MHAQISAILNSVAFLGKKGEGFLAQERFKALRCCWPNNLNCWKYISEHSWELLYTWNIKLVNDRWSNNGQLAFLKTTESWNKPARLRHVTSILELQTETCLRTWVKCSLKCTWFQLEFMKISLNMKQWYFNNY